MENEVPKTQINQVNLNLLLTCPDMFSCDSTVRIYINKILSEILIAK